MTLQRDAQTNFYFGSLSARIPSLWISGVLANRSPALAFSINAAATLLNLRRDDDVTVIKDGNIAAVLQ
jgi:hypothetical protein